MSQSILQQLRSHPFLQDLPEKYLMLIEGCSEEQVFEEGQSLLHYQKPAEEFFLLLEGQVRLFNHMPMGGMTVLETISAPNVTGWSWLLPPYRWHYSAKAIKRSRCLLIHTMCLLGEMEVDAAFAAEMYKRFMMVLVERL